MSGVLGRAGAEAWALALPASLTLLVKESPGSVHAPCSILSAFSLGTGLGEFLKVIAQEPAPQALAKRAASLISLQSNLD